MSASDTKVKHIDGKIQVHKTHPNAEFPSKSRESDIGYDITLIGRSDGRAEDVVNEVNYFNTGLRITPPKGYYLEMMARSSLHKSGYMLATGTSIIDPEYTGEVLVPLYLFKDTGEQLELPFRAVQLVLKKAAYAHISSVKGLDETSRGDAGFGSTGFTPFDSSGAYIQQPQQVGYGGNMQAYQQQVRSYPRGHPRPVAAPPRTNHMF